MQDRTTAPAPKQSKGLTLKERLSAAGCGAICGLVIGIVCSIALVDSYVGWGALCLVPVVVGFGYAVLGFLGGPKLLLTLENLPWS